MEAEGKTVCVCDPMGEQMRSCDTIKLIASLIAGGTQAIQESKVEHLART